MKHSKVMGGWELNKKNKTTKSQTFLNFPPAGRQFSVTMFYSLQTSWNCDKEWVCFQSGFWAT